MSVSSASAKDDLIVDVHFDDGSLLSNVKFQSKNSSDNTIKVKHENEIFTLHFEDLKTIEFVVEPAKVTLKIKTKTGIVVNDRFSISDGIKLRGDMFCLPRSFS